MTGPSYHRATAKVTRMAEAWSKRYARRACREGWGLFSVGGEFGPFEIERDDDSDIFADDDEAVRFVVDAAERGKAHAWEALAIAAVSTTLSEKGKQ